MAESLVSPMSNDSPSTLKGTGEWVWHENTKRPPIAKRKRNPNIIRPEKENLIDYLRTLDKSGGRAKKIRKEDMAAANAKISRADR